MSDLKKRIRTVIAATFGIPVESVTETTSTSTLEVWDSMNHLHLVVALEGEFGISLDPDQAIDLTSIQAIEQTLEALVKR